MQDFSKLLEICGWVAIIVSAVKGVQFLFSITPTGKLKVQVEKNTKHLEQDFEKFKVLENDISSIKMKIEQSERERAEDSKKLNASLNMIGTSVASILNHMIDGNGIEEMKEERDRLMTHFINKN